MSSPYDSYHYGCCRVHVCNLLTPSRCTNFNLFSPLAIYTCISILSSTFHNSLQNPCPFLNVIIYVYDRKSGLNYNIDAFSLSETLSLNIFLLSFSKVFSKKDKFPPGGPKIYTWSSMTSTRINRSKLTVWTRSKEKEWLSKHGHLENLC